MYHLRLIFTFLRASIQQDMAYRSNFLINLMYSMLNLLTGVLWIVVLFGQVRTVHGWNFASVLALLGVYQILGGLRGLVFGPSLETLAGLGGDLWTGNFDFTVLRPVNLQFLASVRNWRIFSLVDLLLGMSVLGVAALLLHQSLTALRIASFIIALCVGIVILYAILLAFTALVFWSQGVLFTWVFNGLFQLARYPVGLYPGWLQLVLSWIVPVGVMTTIPAQALSSELPPHMLISSVLLSIALVVGASFLFQSGLRRYTSASS